MATTTNGSTTNKIVRIQDDEKVLLFQLREIYGNDYKKYFQCIRRGSNIPISIKRIYKLLDERKAYRRISDYFHRERIATKTGRSKPNSLNRSSHHSSTRPDTQLPQPMFNIEEYPEISDEDDNIHQQSTSSTMTNNSEEHNDTNHRIQDDVQDTQPSSSIHSTYQQKRRLASIQPMSSKSDLLSVRTSIQQALRELDRVIVSKPDSIPKEYDDEQHRSSLPQINDHCHSKLDDIVRSLSNVVTQQQENVRLIIPESSTLLVDDHQQSEKISTQDSIKHILERLNTLVDRGHSIYDQIENILSEF